MKRTDPPINTTQDTDRCQSLLKAQSAIYTQAKNARQGRVGVVLGIAVLLAYSSLVYDQATAPVGLFGGIALFAASIFQSQREGQMIDRAVSVQEQFDTTVFDLDWNDFLVPHRPSGQEVHQAAANFRGRPTKRWYSQTASTIRPLDILICQQENLGWGTSSHRRWANALVLAALALSFALATTWLLLDLEAWQGANALAVPFLPVLWETIHAARENYDSAAKKESAQQQVLELWREGMKRPVGVARVRTVQDCIVNLRRTNAPVPDWFDNHFRVRSEKAMHATATEMVAEALRNGKA